MNKLLLGVFALWATVLGPVLKQLDLRPHASHRIEIAIRDNTTGRSTTVWFTSAKMHRPSSVTIRWSDRNDQVNVAARQDGLEIIFTV